MPRSRAALAGQLGRGLVDGGAPLMGNTWRLAEVGFVQPGVMGAEVNAICPSPLPFLDIISPQILDSNQPFLARRGSCVQLLCWPALTLVDGCFSFNLRYRRAASVRLCTLAAELQARSSPQAPGDRAGSSGNVGGGGGLAGRQLAALVVGRQPGAVVL